MEKDSKRLLVIRLRGEVGLSDDVKNTLTLLHLHKVNHAILIDNRPEYLGMLNKVKDLVTWGIISKENVLTLIKKRGRLIGGKKLDNENVKELGYDSVEKLAEDIYSLKCDILKLQKMKPVFRLTPPKGGLRKKKKRSVEDMGALGYRGEAINTLLTKMI